MRIVHHARFAWSLCIAHKPHTLLPVLLPPVLVRTRILADEGGALPWWRSVRPCTYSEQCEAVGAPTPRSRTAPRN
eukprot:scaffold115177_cov40-Prasinocladus_malaysianus.AAC.1